MSKVIVNIASDPDRGWAWSVLVDGRYVCAGDAMFFRRAKRRALEAASAVLPDDCEIEVVKHTQLRRSRVVASLQTATAG